MANNDNLKFCADNPSLCLPKRSFTRTLVIVIIGLLVVGGVASGLSYFYGSNSHYTTTGNIDPTIDGLINLEEWQRADWKIEQYFNVDNTYDTTVNASNVDGFNYIYVGQNTSHLLVAVDLCSDRTNNTEDEWIGLFLNTMECNFGANMTGSGSWSDYADSWFQLRNNGTESLVYSTETKDTLDFIWDTTGNKEDQMLGVFVNGSDGYPDYVNSEVNVSYGKIYDASSGFDEWNHTFIEDGNGVGTLFVVESLTFGEGVDIYDRAVLTIRLDLNKSFSNYPADLRAKVLSDIENMTLIFNGFLQQNSPSHYYSIDDIDYAKVDVANDGKDPLNLTFAGTSDDSFEVPIEHSAYQSGFLDLTFEIKNISIDTGVLWFGIDYLALQYNCSDYVDLVYGSSTIQNFSIAWDFAASPNCNESHRMFEFAIPITELEGYNATGYLGIYVQGYGTLAFPTLHNPYSNYYQVRPNYYFGVGTQNAYFLFFVVYTPASPDWSHNYYKIRMGQQRTILV